MEKFIETSQNSWLPALCALFVACIVLAAMAMVWLEWRLDRKRKRREEEEAMFLALDNKSRDAIASVEKHLELKAGQWTE